MRSRLTRTLTLLRCIRLVTATATTILLLLLLLLIIIIIIIVVVVLLLLLLLLLLSLLFRARPRQYYNMFLIGSVSMHVDWFVSLVYLLSLFLQEMLFSPSVK